MASEPKRQKRQPGSFESLVAGIDDQFEAIEEEIEEMRQELEKADEQSAVLEKRLVEGASGRPKQHG